MTTRINPLTVVEANNRALGNVGFDEIDGTESGSWFCVKAIGADATLSATSEYGDDLSSVTVQNGDLVYGNFSQIAVSSGTVLAYRWN